MNSESLILIVDDREDDQLLLERMLRKVGVLNRIQKLTDGEQALSFFKGDPPYCDRKQYPLPRVLFLDLSLPMLDRLKVLDLIYFLSINTEAYIFIYSLVSNVKEIGCIYRLGADSLLQKPLRECNLLSLIDHFPEAWILDRPR